MNQTIDLSASSTVPDTSSQEFSRANLFGMFLTLQLCQLTQPYGSLLFRGSSGFLWRVNPIASFVEALIIATYLLRTIWQAWREGQGFERTLWGKKLRATASALLLLRGALEDEDGGLMGMLMAASFLDGAQHAEPRPEDEGTTPPGVGAGQEAAEAPPEPSQMPDMPESYEMGAMTTQSDSQDRQTVMPQQVVLRRRTSQLESAPPRRADTINGPDPYSDRSQLLRAAFGPNALAHREMRIDIVTAVSVLAIFVKLLAVRSQWVFLIAAHFMVYGWLLVQALLLIFHSREMSDLDKASSIRAARSLYAALKESSRKWWSLYVALHAPFLGYICYVLVFRLELPHWMSFIVMFICYLIAYFAYLICFSLIIFGMPWSLYKVLSGSFLLVISLYERFAAGRGRTSWSDVWEDYISALLGILGSPLILWIGLGAFTYRSKMLRELYPDRYEPYIPMFGNSTMNTIVDSGFTKTVTGVWIIILFFVLITIFCVVLLPGSTQARHRVSWGNLLVTVSVFIYYLITYDPQGSNKPAWTEWLG